MFGTVRALGKKPRPLRSGRCDPARFAKVQNVLRWRKQLLINQQLTAYHGALLFAMVCV
jgi:hypothetical protein